jgi:Protein of unknown function (DUF3102)
MQESTNEKQLSVNRASEIWQLADEAKQFHAEAQEARAAVEHHVTTGIEKAWQCGKRLNAIKAIVGHGNWLPWLRSNWPELTVRTAQSYMKIDHDNPNALHVAHLKLDSIRKYRLSLVPEKPQPNIEGDIKFPRLVSFLNIANEYSRLKERHISDLERVDFDEAKEETLELYRFLRWLHNDTSHNPWEDSRSSCR